MPRHSEVLKEPASPNQFIQVPSWIAGAEAIPFEMQPIMDISSGTAFGYEMLYRGMTDPDWLNVDLSLITYLGDHKGLFPTLFINLANDTLLSLDVELFINASQGNKIIFEVSEKFADHKTFSSIAGKINVLASHGLDFAIDDFGNGQDGMKRLYSLDSCESIKIDGDFLRIAMEREDAATTLKSLLTIWRNKQIITIAECVETLEIFNFTKQLGFDLVQGWHVDKMIVRD